MKRKKITLKKLENFLFGAADDLRDKLDASEYKEFIFGMLFIKRMSDVFEIKRKEVKRKYTDTCTPEELEILIEDSEPYGETFFVPKFARWNDSYKNDDGELVPALKDVKINVGERLNKAISALEAENPVLEGVLKNNIDFNAIKGKTKIPDSKWINLLNRFNNPEFILTEDNFEFPDLLGAAYEYLIADFADSAGKKGGEFYTPAEVVRLMVQLVKPRAKMEVYDPTVGSGGMLIQSRQYVEEHGQDPDELRLFGQDSKGTVWAICKMNMILHGIADADIENADTIEDPRHIEAGTIKKFDRILANPPFSQNYDKANIKFPHRFRHFTPEAGKKADLMFVQHMVASLKKNGLMATVMPHGVLFRGGKEKEIRQEMISDDFIEAIISLPPALFYNTGIPACILIINKSKPDRLRNKILFINADREYFEGKAQNKLRPEDIEKIDFVFTTKDEIPKYSRLIEQGEIIKNDYNLNIRRYVDNTPEPEPEDVKAHLLGGVPKVEVESYTPIYEKFNFNSALVFTEKSEQYFNFQPSITEKQQIKPIIEADKNVQLVFTRMGNEITEWWQLAQADFIKLENNNLYAQVREELITSIKEKFLPIGVLDQFKIAGVFVNWWQTIRYDLKTIISSGWHQTLIPDNYLIEKFFQAEADEIAETESRLSEAEANLTETIEAVEYEADEDEKVTVKRIKDFLKEEIKSLQESASKTKDEEIATLKKQFDAVLKFEIEVKKSKWNLKRQRNELERKILLKREGTDDERLNLTTRIKHLKIEFADLLGQSATDPKAEKKQQKNLKDLKEKTESFEQVLKQLDAELEAIGGIITDEEAKELILKKLFDLINNELNRYLNAEKRALISSLEKLWDKYAVPAREIEIKRDETMKMLNNFLTQLGYLEEFAIAQA